MGREPRPKDFDPDVMWHLCDLLDISMHADLMQAVQPTHLLHLAWCAIPGKYWTSPDDFVHRQTNGTSVAIG